jgi:hypothetical protein
MTSHMKKKKAKRYQEGGEAEDKKRGLAASNKEGSVGFFERLRMGNIDDPKSEAYKRFGAGRGKAETAKTKASTIDQIGDRERMEAFTAGPLKSQAAAPMEDKKPAKAASKPAIVTKEQLKASGFDNLRDYLNDQRRLTRRGESSPRKPAADKQQFLVDPLAALKTKVTLVKKQLVRPKRLRWPKPVRCASKQILAMFQQMFVAPKRRQQRASAVT